MKGGKIKVMIPGRNMPFVKKQHGEITSFYAMRDKEIAQEREERTKAQIKQAAAIGNAAFSTTAMPDKPLADKATA